MKINEAVPPRHRPAAATVSKPALIRGKYEIYAGKNGSVFISLAQIVTLVFGGTAHHGVQSKEKGSELSAIPSSRPRQ
ncbi:hypothetical protein AGR13a_Lc100066 [Agrobacterium genomosp. 13 str. CFBP 6927]|uniref:Uncharacterized protein n=1 Tax=Agrobacterium genomosp. 13 str. CFBP 6927 TaxID=1183428 RepID=A0ABM9VIK4_9HYPH|nr:hypothetical protein AGR13a_Lc100066 [Agrobacterium genomosp. 13 str. CFBP 6927]